MGPSRGAEPGSKEGSEAPLEFDFKFKLKDMDIAEDVEAELQVFVQLARLELFTAASDWFHECLSSNQSMFPVLVEHLDMLLQEGSDQAVLNILHNETQEEPGKTLAAHDETNRDGISQLLASMKTLAKVRLEMLQADALLAALEDCRRYLETEWPGDASEDATAIRIHIVEVYLGIVMAALESGLITEQERVQYTNPPWTTEETPEWSGFCAWYTYLRKSGYHWEAQRIQSILLPKVTFEEAEKTFIKRDLSEVVPGKGDFDESFVLSMLVMSNTVCAYLLKAAESQPHLAKVASNYLDISRFLKTELSRKSTLNFIEKGLSIEKGLPLKQVDKLELELKQIIEGGIASTIHKVARDIASTGMKIVSDSVGTFAKIRSDVAGTVIKIANDVGETARHILRGEDITRIPNKVLYDGLGTGVKIVTDTTGTLAKVRADVADTVAKVLSDSSSTASKVVKDTLSTVDKIALDAETTVSKIRDTLKTGVHAASRALSSRAADVFLKYATDVFTAADDAAVADAILQVIHRSREAMTQSLSGAALIWRAIFTNGVNETSLNFILNHLPELGQWLYDLVKPESVLGRFPATDGATETLDAEFPGMDNPYNELDLRLPENRNAVACQAQRVALTIVAILKMGRDKMLNGLDDVQLNVSLRSDFDANANPPSPTYISALHGGPPSPPNEKWLFINGIANEFFWFQRSCDKIRNTFNREVTGVYNRSDGILWDFIECCGERRDAEPNTLIESTQSSKAAQKALEQELRGALWPAAGKVPDKVVMIAHSQGCLVLRLALQTLVTEIPKGSPQRLIIKKKLRIFTFGNPSIDWKVKDGTEHPLRKYVHTTEHFVNETDFVAMLGVVMHRDDQGSGYDPNLVFYSKAGKAHLFGAHYSLGVNAYHGGENSQLLKAVNGTEIA